MKFLLRGLPNIAMAVAVAVIFQASVDWYPVIEWVICFFVGVYFGKQVKVKE